VKAVFDVKQGSGYDDDVTVRYHFPARSNYLDVARNALGDWVLFREPRRNRGRQAYVATAKVVRVEADPRDGSHYYAYVADYLEFSAPVPFVTNGRYAETPLRAIGRPDRVGQSLQGRSMRVILNEDFDAIVLSGLSDVLASEDAFSLGLDFPRADFPPPFAQPGMAETTDRRVEQILVNRQIREANFRLEVCRAYNNRCAVTGLKIINGGGRAEVQAAHIKPVAAGGPDVVQNGIALSATVHWLFDRHLISISEDYCLLVSHNRVPSTLTGIFRPEHERLYLPSDERLWPHRAFIAYHRELYAGG
jgi:putative restriction endonuclease